MQAIHASGSVRIRMFFVPDNAPTSVPLQRFYRTAIHSEPVFDTEGRCVFLRVLENDIPSQEDTAFSILRRIS